DLTAFGRLSEGVAAIEAALQFGKQHSDWRSCAVRAATLSSRLLTLGRIGEAISAAKEAIELIDRTDEARLKAACRKLLADVIFQTGAARDARSMFAEAATV